MNINWLFLIVTLGFLGLIYFAIVHFLKWQKIIAGGIAVILSCVFFYVLVFYVGSAIQLNRFDTELRQNYPIFQIIADNNPEQYQQFLTQISDNLKFDFGDVQLEALSFDLMNQVYPKYLAKAPNDAIFSDLQATLDLYEKIAEDSPVLVLKLEFPERFLNIDLDRLTNPYYKDILQESRNAKTALVESAIADPQPTPNGAVVEPEITRIIAGLVDLHGEELVAQTFNGNNDDMLDKKQAATVIIDFYRSLLAQMPQGAGQIVRFFSAEATK